MAITNTGSQCERGALSRRDFLAGSLAVAATNSLLPREIRAVTLANEPTDIGDRRELFVDSALIQKIGGQARQQLHCPTPREVVMQHDEPWEGTGSGYHSIFRDGNVYRMYYKAWHLEASQGKLNSGRHPLYCCYAESPDGIRWRKPHLRLHEFEGSKNNNITLASGKLGPLNVDAGHPAIFKDENPAAPPEARYKAIVRSSNPNGLLPFQSADGLSWTPMTDAPILRGLGAFDSQNLAFWDSNIQKYRAYWRIFTAGVTTEKEWKPRGYRAIRTATSEDLVHWEPHTDLTYEDSPPEQLYTNQIKPYHRAPHILIGFPTRYIDRGWSPSMKSLPDLPEREIRASSVKRYGTAITEALVMASRDGRHFKRWNEAFVRPGIERTGTWHYGQQYLAWHLVETKSDLPGAPNELSLYGCESYWHGKGSQLRRYTLRLDGFVSISAPWTGGDLTTKPVVFSGSQLELNASTSAAGGIRVELQKPDGTPIPGYTAEDCDEFFGDTVQRSVTWNGSASVEKLSGQPVRLRFSLRDADLYAYQFTRAKDSA